MLKHIPTLQKLIRQLQHIPYLASKNLYRVASHLLSSDEGVVQQLCDAILDVRRKVRPCKVCFNWTEGCETCVICSCDSRDKSRVCVVETWHDLIAIERAQDYNGLYHILGGSLSPLEGIGPEDLTIDAFIERLQENVTSGIIEIILATNPTPEGEATASYIASKITSGVTISRLASGIPIGYSLEQMDRVTIHKAMSGRRPF